jgi:histidinol-phosphate phosphatase family protein
MRENLHNRCGKRIINKALFLDRDGTIIVDKHYINNPTHVELIEDVVRAMAAFQQHGYLLIVITNQSGIARGLITWEQYHAVNRRMEQLLSHYGVKIDDYFVCPMLPPAPCRKPSPLMIEQACEKWCIDKSRSLMVGDKDSDVEAGKRAGVKAFTVSEFLKRWRWLL